MSYRNRRVVLIGGLGFIGSHLTRHLEAQGARVTVTTLSPARHADGIAECGTRGIPVIEADLRDAEAMRRAVADQEIVFNLAGQSGAVRSAEDPLTDLEVNCGGNIVLLEALRRHNAGAKIVFASSRLAYGEGGSEPAAERRTVDPLCLHAVHKLAVEQYLRIYERLYGLRYSVARLTNPYGPGQPHDRTAYGIVNRFVHLALADDVLPIYGDGRQRRDYIFIEDAVEAFAALGESSAADGRTYNVGSGSGTPLVEMARAICAKAGGGRLEFVPWPAVAKQMETGDFVADVTRIRDEIGWEPRVALAEGLDRTIAFYRAHAA